MTLIILDVVKIVFPKKGERILVATISIIKTHAPVTKTAKGRR